MINNKYNYPLNFTFKIGTLSNDFIATDSLGRTLAYVRQKMFTLKSKVDVFGDTNKTRKIYDVRADAWLKFNISYEFLKTDNQQKLGRIVRKGVKSLWKSRYELYDEHEQQDLLIQEENAWVKVLDQFFTQIPIIGMLSGYVFNPSYIISRPDGTPVARVTKEQSFWGRRFTLNTLNAFEVGEEERILLGSMMMLLLERRKG